MTTGLQMPRGLLVGCVAIAGLGVPGGAAEQRPITYAEVAALPAPPPDHRIAYGPDPLQFGHLRLPEGPGPHPVVVFVHGGCYLNQYTIDHVGPLEQAIADAGYAVWSLEYRRVGDEGGGWPGTFRDVARGADHLRRLAGEHRLDLDRVVAAGHSAGGNLALWLAARGKLRPESEVNVGEPLPIRAVLALAPVPDLKAAHAAGHCNNVVEALLGGSPTDRPERYRDTSPMELVPLGVPQVLVVGRHDERWKAYVQPYHEHAVTAGDTLVTLVEAAESGHFDVIAPGSTTWSLVLASLRSLFDRMGQ